MTNETEIKEVVFTEDCGREYKVKLGIKIQIEWLDDLCKEIISDLYHLEEKPTYTFVIG